MKCPICHGKGRIQDHKYNEEHDIEYLVYCEKKCEYCNGTGEVQMTNEEYLKSCNTEQLAEVLADVALWMHPFMKQKNRFELLKKQFYEWLKQPHTIKE